MGRVTPVETRVLRSVKEWLCGWVWVGLCMAVDNEAATAG